MDAGEEGIGTPKTMDVIFNLYTAFGLLKRKREIEQIKHFA
jgi:hypothetical protein